MALVLNRVEGLGLWDAGTIKIILVVFLPILCLVSIRNRFRTGSSLVQKPPSREKATPRVSVLEQTISERDICWPELDSGLMTISPSHHFPLPPALT